MSYLCVRCGRTREEHDTNLVIESDEYLVNLKGEEIVSGYHMSLLTCSDTPRPAEYTKLMLENTWIVGWGAGYVSPDPQAENAERQAYLNPWWQEYLAGGQETLFIVPGQGIVAYYKGH